MVIPIDTSNHWRYITGRETVWYFAKTVEGFPNAGVSVPNAKRWPVSKQLVIADAMLAKNGLRWTVWLNQLSDIVPKIGDKIVDQYGVAWLVTTPINVESLGQRFDLTCVRSQKS